MIATELSIHEIELIAVQFLGGVRTNIIVPNLSWGLLNHEADLVSINKSGYLTEIEIKRSFEDFKADFKKDIYHDSDERVYRFCYFVPFSILEKCTEYNREHAKDVSFYGNPYLVIGYQDDGSLWNIPYDSHDISHYFGSATYSQNPKARKLFIEEQLKVAKLGCMRLFPIKEQNKRLK